MDKSEHQDLFCMEESLVQGAAWDTRSLRRGREVFVTSPNIEVVVTSPDCL